MTDTVFARGSKWSDSLLYDGWGNETPQELADKMGSLVVDRFHELCAEAGDPSIHWQPATSEVIGKCMGETTDEHHWSTAVHPMTADLDDLRKQAEEETWRAFGEGHDSPMSAKVKATLDKFWDEFTE